MRFKDVFGKKFMLFDGSTGTALQKAGLAADELPEEWNFSHPEKIAALHRSYIEAGCDVIATNTFGANPFKMSERGMDADAVIKRAVAIARAEAEKAEKQVFVALSAGPLGRLLSPLGDLEFEDAVAAFAGMCVSARDAGADLILFETISDPYEMKAALLAARENTDLPVIITMMPGKDDRLISGGEPAAAAVMLCSMGVDGIGLNCGEGPEQFLRVLPGMMPYVDVPVLCSPNAGLPHGDEHGCASYDVSPAEYAAMCRRLAEYGASALGGCCGTDSDYIKAVNDVMQDFVINPPARASATRVSSRSRVAEFGGKPLIVGERINPTGKSAMKAALKEDDMSYIMREAVSQTASGADILDVNVGLPGIDEPAMLVRAVTAAQKVTELPLQIDTADKTALEKALRVYNGKPLINSVNASPESMDKVFPLVKKYGGAVVCLAMDEKSIPETPAGRAEVIGRIVRRAAEYGIPACDLIADGLVTTAATDPDAANKTLDAIALIKEKYGICSILGISNISFGLPEREKLNAAFLSAALGRGLSAAIMNPLSAPVAEAYREFVQSGAYGEFAVGDTGVRKFDGGEITLKTAVVFGLAEQAAKEAAELAKTQPPMDIVNNELIPALDEVGADYESGKSFLPQLLMSADAAKSAFEEIKRAYAGKGEGGEKIVMATVQGDIHDIGKNIVKALLENYGYDVIDLGKDVPPETVLDAVERTGARLVGLSALMTTTVVNMEKTIRLLHEKAPQCKVMVGGAVLNEEYARAINADYYAADAVGAVKCAGSFFGVKE